MNAGAALYIAGKAESLEAGVKMAENLIDSGAAAAKLEEFIRLSNKLRIMAGGEESATPLIEILSCQTP